MSGDTGPTEQELLTSDAGCHVLVVDDDATWRYCVTLALTPTHRVSEAADGNEAIALLQRDDSIDVILLDLMMPHRTGPEVFAWLEEHRPALAQRTGIMTGGTPAPAAAAFYAQCRCPKLLKPIDSVDLIAMVQALSGRSQPST